MCKIVTYAVPDGPPYYAGGAYKAVSKCEEHHCTMEGYMTQLPTEEILCPIGRIEKATEDGLAKIKAELGKVVGLDYEAFERNRLAIAENRRARAMMDNMDDDGPSDTNGMLKPGGEQ